MARKVAAAKAAAFIFKAFDPALPLKFNHFLFLLIQNKMNK